VVSGFYAGLTNGIGPTDQPIRIGVQINRGPIAQTVTIPTYPSPLNLYTRQNRQHTVPLDVAQRYHRALSRPYPCRDGDELRLVIVACGATGGEGLGIRGGFQFHGQYDLSPRAERAGIPDPVFREARGSGPLTAIAWGPAEKIVTGNQIQFDPLCAPQNNSGVIADEDGTLFQVTSYYSVDEQYGGGRQGSIARLYGFRKRPGASEWRPLGCLVDPLPLGLVYAGDPFVFRDFDGIPCVAFTTAEGKESIAGVQAVGGMLLRSTTRSFAGPWHLPRVLFEKYPLGTDKEARVICLRVFPRETTHDYVILWQFGLRDITIRGLVRPSLDPPYVPLPHGVITDAPVLVRNQEEGGGGFRRGPYGYLSTWQIPSINDPTGMQRVYRFEMEDPLNPAKWVPLSGSWGWNAASDPWQDGGETADAWSLSLDAPTDRLFATSVVYSLTHQKNSLMARSVQWDERVGGEYRFGAPRIPAFRFVSPVVEYAVGPAATLEVEIDGLPRSSTSPLILVLGDADTTMGHMAGIRMMENRAAFITISPNGQIREKTARKSVPYPGDPAAFVSIRLAKIHHSIRAWVNARFVGGYRVKSWVWGWKAHPDLRFRLFAQDGEEYRVRRIVLTDGAEGICN
jgi:hypothetical protein